MGKTINYLLVFILLTSIVYAANANYEYLYNPYTAKRDRTLKLNQSGYNTTYTNGTFDNLLVKNPPVKCPTGTYMVYTNMTTAICVSAMRIDGENVTGFYNFSDNMAVNDTLYVYDGKVGIGTSNPAVKLEISEAQTSGAIPVFRVQNTHTGNTLNTFELLTPNMPDGGYMYMAMGKEASNNNRAGIKYLHVSDGSASNRIDFGVYGNDELFSVLASGNIGIGTTSPSYLLQVANTSNAVNLSGIFYVDGDTGNVGIGTASPTANLHIDETITDVTTAHTLSKINLTLNTANNIAAYQTALDIDFNVISARDIHKPLKGINVDMNTENTDPASHIEAAYGIYIDVVSDAASDNNAYGLFVKNVTGGTGNLYGIYSNASENKIENKLIVGNLETSEDIQLARSTVQNTTGKKIVWGRTEGPFIASYKTGTDSDSQAIVIYDHESASGGNAALFNTIFRDGNVGIGITSPNYKLDVMGDVNASNYYINGSSIFEILDNNTIIRTHNTSWWDNIYYAITTRWGRANTTDYLGGVGTNASLLRVGNMSDIRETSWDFANNDTFVLDNDTIIRSNFNGTLGAYYLYPNGTNPISLNHLVNKEFVELAVSGLTLDYFFTNVTSDIAGYYVLNNTERSAPQSIVESVSLSSGNNQSVFNFSTTAGLPFIFLSEGIYDAHIHLDKTGGAAQIIHPRWELHKRNSSGDFLITISETSNVEITGTNQIFNLHAVFNDDVPIVSTDRLVIKLFVDITGGGSSTVRLYMEGTTDSHFTFRTPSSVLQEIFIRRDGANELTGNWNVGGFDIVNIGNISADTLLGKWNGSVKYSLETDAFKVENGTALPFSNFQIENVSNVTPWSQVTDAPASSNFQLANVSNDTIGQQELIDFNNSLAYSNFKLENVSNDTIGQQELIDFNGSLMYSNFQLANVSNDTVGYSELFNFMEDNITSANTSSNVKEYGGNVTGTYDALILNPCANTEILKYDTTGKWVCSADNTGGAPDTTDYWHRENTTDYLGGKNFSTYNESLDLSNYYTQAEADAADDDTIFDSDTMDIVNTSMLDNATIIRTHNTTWWTGLWDLVSGALWGTANETKFTNENFTNQLALNLSDISHYVNQTSNVSQYVLTETDPIASTYVINRTLDEIGDQANSSLLNYIDNKNKSDYLDRNMGWTNLTDYPTACPVGSYLTEIGDTTTCTTTLVVNDTTPKLGGNLNVSEYDIILSELAGSADTSSSGITTYMQVDVNAFGFGALLYIASDGNLEPANASSGTTTLPAMGMALAAGTGVKEILLQGFVRDDSWGWTPGDMLYVSNETKGNITANLPLGSDNVVQIIGIATHADRIYFNPEYAMVEIT